MAIEENLPSKRWSLLTEASSETAAITRAVSQCTKGCRLSGHRAKSGAARSC